MSWKKGDTAIVHAPVALCDKGQINGQQVQLLYFEGRLEERFGSDQIDWWRVSADNSEKWAREIALRKPYDGNELCEWKTCVFQPKELVVVN